MSMKELPNRAARKLAAQLRKIEIVPVKFIADAMLALNKFDFDLDADFDPDDENIVTEVISRAKVLFQNFQDTKKVNL